MTIAELHGKLSSTGRNLSEKMEDLLTSDVFTACKYVRPETLLLPFLGNAKNIDGDKLSNFLPKYVARIRYGFWKLIKESEPDLVIDIKKLDGQHILLVIEAKYFSMVGTKKDTPDEFGVAEVSPDQLEREYRDLQRIYRVFQLIKSSVEAQFLVLVTAHRGLPEFLYDPKVSFPVFWTSWYELHTLLGKRIKSNDWEKPILKDLKLLLERKRLSRYAGVGPLSEPKIIHSLEIYRPRRQKKIGLSTTRIDAVSQTLPQRLYRSQRDMGRYRWKTKNIQLSEIIYKGKNDD